MRRPRRYQGAERSGTVLATSSKPAVLRSFHATLCHGSQNVSPAEER
ncbi:MAG TPA: hypothetical protein VLZ09_00225 [Gaiellaceae bacterium]|nr:hypothetical protein [Gaiellaceae bacterium]